MNPIGRKIMPIIVVLLCCGTVCVPDGSAQQAALPVRHYYEVGRVDETPLIDVAPEELKKACDFLINNHVEEARPIFERQLARNSNDLIAFVGSAQCNPAQWLQQISHIEQNLVITPDDNKDQFRLATLIYYAWGSHYKELTERYSKSHKPVHPLRYARSLLEQCWDKDKSPVVGLMLHEVCTVSSATAEEKQTVMGSLIAQLAGRKAYALYRQAAEKSWTTMPPPTSLVPFQNRAALRGVLKTVWSNSASRSRHGRWVNGKVVIGDPTPISEDNQHKMVYLDRWIQALKQAQ